MIKKAINTTDEKILLLVEDDPLQAMTVTRSLANYGYRVLHADTALDAIQLVQTNSEIQLILMEMQNTEFQSRQGSISRYD